MRRLAALLLALALFPAAPLAAQAPLATQINPSDTVAALIANAYRTGNDATIQAVIAVAKATFPDQSVEIDRLAAGNAGALAVARRDERLRAEARIAAASFFEIWKGEVEAGASRSTGSTKVVGIYAAARLNRDGLNWRQRFTGRLDYQETDGQRTTERLIAAYQPNYKLSETLYSYGLAQVERDPSLGYSSRGTLGAGLGYVAASGIGRRVELEAGPALRRTNFIGPTQKTSVAARASFSAQVPLSPTLVLTQNAAVFLEANDTTATSTTAIDTKLIGDLKARLSYNLQYEQSPFDGGNSLDTITRATLVYSF
jgi:putative salt-induced outer membrane protein